MAENESRAAKVADEDSLNPAENLAAKRADDPTSPSNPDDKITHVPSDVNAEVVKARDEAAAKATEDGKTGPEIAKAARRAALAALRKHEKKMAPGVGLPKSIV